MNERSVKMIGQFTASLLREEFGMTCYWVGLLLNL